MPPDTEGWIKLHRKIKNSSIYQAPPKVKLLFVEILLDVEYENNYDYIGSEKVEVKKGETLQTYKELSNKINCSKSTVKRYLDILREETSIETQTETRGKYRKTRITVTEWDKYQKNKDEKEGVERETERQPERTIERDSERQCTKEVEELQEDLSFQDKQAEIVGALKEAGVVEKINGSPWGLAGKWIKAYEYDQVINTLKEIGCKNEWSTIRKKDKPVATIVNWIKNREDEPTNPDAEALSRAMGN